ncbi:hypothetical protein BH20ACI2_BH20ACI2_06340 [soil metagenome]
MTQLPRIVIIGIFLICLTSTGYSQNKKPRAYRLVEFNSIQKPALSLLIDAFLAVVKNTDGSQGYVVNYGSVSAINSRKKLLSTSNRWSCGYDGCRITFVEGPKPTLAKTVFWVVPEGADPPEIE